MKYLNYRQLPVFKESHEFVKSVYHTISKFPNFERYGLANQLRRAGVSIPSNIVEGMNRRGTKELMQFLYQAKASLSECDYQIYLSHELGYINREDYLIFCQKIESILIQLHAWIKKLKENHDQTINHQS